MNLDKVIVGDIETIGLLKKVSKPGDLHVLSCSYKDAEGTWQIKSTKDPEDIKKVVSNPKNTIVFHNGVCFDRPALEKMGWEFNAEIIDTLPISYYLYSERDKHGLGDWGEFFGVPKPVVEDWEGLSYEEYKHRCEEDVKINTRLWIMMLTYLRKLYDTDEEIVRVIRYLNQKAYTLHLQEQNPLLIDLELAEKNLAILEEIIEEKTKELTTIMPDVPVLTKRTKPKVMFLKKGGYSAAGERWMNLLEKQGLPPDYEGDVKEVTGYDPPNPGSSKQMKDFLFSKGWEPQIFVAGTNGDVPQLRDKDKNLCKSIYELIERFPELEALDGLSVAQHRAGYLKSFIEKSDDEGYCNAWAHGFTRTLRLKHVAPFVNMPKPSATYGELVRSCIIAPEGYVCIGADLSSIEDKCKQISIYPYDPEYVESMNSPGWDAHLALGLRADMFTEDEVQFYKWYKSIGKEVEFGECPKSFETLEKDALESLNHGIDKRRASAKTTNYACLPEDNTEVLTRRGWIKADLLAYDDEVLSYNPVEGTTKFTEIDEIHRYKDAKVFSLSNKWWNIESTADHRWLVDKRVGGKNTRRIEQMYVETQDINTECNIINSKPYEGGDWDITVEEAEFLGWLLSDGYYKWSEKSTASSTSNGKKRGIQCSVSQSKKKYYKDIEYLLFLLGAQYNEYQNNSGVEVFDFKSSWARAFFDRLGIERKDKHEVDWVKYILKMGKRQLQAFFTAFVKADGSTTKSGFTIYQNGGNIAEAIELCGNLLGYRTTKSFKTNQKCLEIRFNSISHTTGQRLKRDYSRTTDVFCLTVPFGNFVIRQKGTITITGNCTYGAGVATIAAGANIPRKEAKKLHKGYWDLNWSVKEFAKDRIVKEVEGITWLRLNKKAGGLKKVNSAKWIWNEYSNLWLYLKNDKDRFSACNQNFGVKVFDVWGYLLISKGIFPSFQAHDEYLWYCKIEDVDKHKAILQSSVDQLNKIFDPPVPIEIDYKIGNSYAEVH